MRTVALFWPLVLLLSGCFPTDVTGKKPDGSRIEVLFYPGGSRLDDLIIAGGRHYFGKAQYQIGDPLADIGFRLNSGERVQAECVQVGKDIVGEDECKRYEVYRSSWMMIPEGTIFDRPEMF